jgi:hypothetical protein
MGFKVSLTVSAVLLLPFGSLRAQIPPGPPYVAENHPNAIVTFVDESDFVPTTYQEARSEAGFELLGLSGSEGRRETVEITAGKVEEVRILGRRTEVLYYPVVRQKFLLPDGETFTLYSFRNPRTDLPPEALNQHAFQRHDKPEDRRFGPDLPPGEFVVRSTDALIFVDDDGRSVFWQESGRSHVAASAVDFDTLILLIEDLL